MGNGSDATPFSANDGAMLAAPNKRVLGASSRSVLCMLDLLERADPCLPKHLMRRRLAKERSIGDAPRKSPGGQPGRPPLRGGYRGRLATHVSSSARA